MYCLCGGFALTVCANVPSARRCSICLAQPRAAIFLRVGVGAEGEMSMVLLNWNRLFLLLGAADGLSGSCSSTWHGGGDKQ